MRWDECKTVEQRCEHAILFFENAIRSNLAIEHGHLAYDMAQETALQNEFVLQVLRAVKSGVQKHDLSWKPA